MMRKSYSPEYKEHAAKLVVEDRRVGKEVARELGISYATLYEWIKKYRKKLNPAEGEVIPLTPSEYEKKIAAYEKRLHSIEEENAILKKAMHIFTKNPE